SLVSDDFGVFEEDGAAVSHRVGALGMGHGAWARKERYAGNILGWSPRPQRALALSGPRPRPELRANHCKCHRACTFLAIVARTAMRTATPFVTCCWMTDCGPSAISLEISTSRFIGPGCMTIASGRALRRRVGVIPNSR